MIIKKLYMLIAITSFIFLTGCGSDNTSDNSDATETTTEAPTTNYSGNGYDIYIPEDWKYNTDASTSFSDTYGTPFDVFSYVGSTAESAIFNENININIQDLTDTNYDFTTYKSLVSQQYEALEYHITSQEDTKHDGYSSWLIEYTLTANDVDIMGRQLSIEVGNFIYTITYTADTEDFSKLSDEVNTILNSIAFPN